MRPSFDLQAHRGGMGLWPQNSLEAFANALALGVSTLELDVQVSLDGQPVLSHDRVLPEGEFISWLPRESLGLPTLGDVFALLGERGADDVRVNIETKFDVVHPDEVAPRERFAEVVVDAVRTAGMVHRVSVQSFDWDVLDRVLALEPAMSLNVLTNTSYEEVGVAGASPWMAGVDIDDFLGDIVASMAGRGYAALSPYAGILDDRMLRAAHDGGLKVIPYTVDEPADLERLVRLGVDGVITNRPDVAREVLASLGLPLPAPYP